MFLQRKIFRENFQNRALLSERGHHFYVLLPLLQPMQRFWHQLLMPELLCKELSEFLLANAIKSELEKKQATAVNSVKLFAQIQLAWMDYFNFLNLAFLKYLFFTNLMILQLGALWISYFIFFHVKHQEERWSPFSENWY